MTMAPVVPLPVTRASSHDEAGLLLMNPFEGLLLISFRILQQHAMARKVSAEIMILNETLILHLFCSVY